jgi:8-oxo-dGTP pyrophosphatase MutT (NUDIX family)
MSYHKDLYRSRISTSYGIVCYTYEKDTIKFLMTLRRDTFCYECIIRGIYQDSELEDYVSHITKEERERILNFSFDMLWKDLWVSPRRRLYRIEYKKAHDKFKQYKEKIMTLVENMTEYDNVLWEFPKGKMFSEENPVQCALREFEEETNISKQNIQFIKQAGLFKDAFTGNDQREYHSVYYLGFIPNGTDIAFTYHTCPHKMRNKYVSDEVMSIEWLSYEEALERCTPTKKVILSDIHRFLYGVKQ